MVSKKKIVRLEKALQKVKQHYLNAKSSVSYQEGEKNTFEIEKTLQRTKHGYFDGSSPFLYLQNGERKKR